MTPAEIKALVERLDDCAAANRDMHRDALACLLDEAATALRSFMDERDGLTEDLFSAVEVAYRRGAREWARLNYPQWIGRLEANEAARHEADKPAMHLAAMDGAFPWVNLSETAKNQYREQARNLPTPPAVEGEAGE